MELSLSTSGDTDILEEFLDSLAKLIQCYIVLNIEVLVGPLYVIDTIVRVIVWKLFMCCDYNVMAVVVFGRIQASIIGCVSCYVVG